MIVGKCGGLWWGGGILVCGIVAVGRGVWGEGNISDCGMGAIGGVRTAGRANFHKF